MAYAVNIGLVHHNPLAGIKETIPVRKAVNCPTLKPDELPELMSAINFANIKFTTLCLIEWQLHVMVRLLQNLTLNRQVLYRLWPHGFVAAQ